MILRFVLGAAVALFAAAPLSAARADLMFDLSVTPISSLGWTGSGSIDLTTMTGTSTADVAAFSFHVATGAGSPQNYAIGDINTISWSIDSADDLSLVLISKLIPFGNETTAILLTNESGAQTQPCNGAMVTPGSSLTCELFGGGFAVHNSDAVLTATSVPEPSSLALLTPTLLGLAGYFRRRAQRCA